MKVIFAFLITILALNAQGAHFEGGYRHAFLKSREGVRIYVDFQKQIIANGGSSAATWTAEKPTVYVVLPSAGGTLDCNQQAPVDVELHNWKAGSSEPATQYRVRLTPQPARICVYAGKLTQSLPVRTGGMGRFTNYRQYLNVKVRGRSLVNPIRYNGEDQNYFELQLEQVPENGLHNLYLEQ